VFRKAATPSPNFRRKLLRRTAAIIAEGKILGWYQGAPNGAPRARQPQHRRRPAPP